MKTTLNVEEFVRYAEATEKYMEEQLDIISEALYMLEDDLSKLSWKQYGLYSDRYIGENLNECGEKIKVYMMTAGMKQAKAKSAVADFKKWFRSSD